MSRLVSYLDGEFGSRREVCVLVIEPKIPEVVKGRVVYWRPDALVVKDNVLCLVELKGFGGDIVADCSRGGLWRLKEGGLLSPVGSPNPFSRARSYRVALLKFLTDNFSISENAPGWAQGDQESIRRYLESNIHSWVVTEEASRSEIVGINPREFPFFRVMSLDKLPQALTFLRSDPLLSPVDMDRLLTLLEATRVSRDEWFRLGLQDSVDQARGLIRKITSWADAEDPDNVLKALRYIKELDLKQHRPHVIRSWKSPHPEIRMEALLILLDWQDERIGSILNEALQDKSHIIVDFSLDYLSKYGYPEAITTLTTMLEGGTDETLLDIIKAIASSGHSESCQIIFSYLKSFLSNKPFERIENYHQELMYGPRNEATKERRRILINMIQEERRLFDLTALMISSLGELQCKESASWLVGVLTRPTSIGFSSDDYLELDSKVNFDRIFGALCGALGRFGVADIEFTSFLLERLVNSPQIFQYHVIELLGNLGEVTAVPALLKLLEDQESPLYNVTVTALSKIGTDESFDALAEAYISNPSSYSGALTGGALRRINIDWFIDLILDQIRSNQVKSKAKRVYLQALLGSVTLRCANTLFDLLKNKELSNLASWNLSFLVGYERVFERAMELTWSKNPLEKASAIWVLEKHFVENPHELERFETDDAPKEVRRAISAVYMQSKSKDKLFRYAKDPDPEVRDIVYQYFLDKLVLGRYYFASDAHESSICDVAVDDEFIGIKLDEEVLIFSKNDIVKAGVTDCVNDTFGLYLAIKKGETIGERLLLVPTRNYYGIRETIVEEFKTMYKINSEVLETDINNSQLDAICEKARNLIQKQ